jgi:alkylation response protein AidB-like acyl-CoA dehydrogenase
MATYKAPLRDMQFVMYDLLQVDRMPDMRGWESAAPDLVSAVLEEAGKLCEEVLFPLNRSGDEEGCTYENGVVRTPKGFKEAYKAFTDGGWTGIACAEQYGGQELPHIVSTAVEEMICAANMSFGMYPGLSAGAYRAVAMHGSQEIKDRYLPKLTSGEWSGTMCLTEPQCGTDLGLIRTKAVASTTSRATSSIWCSRGFPMRRRGSRASACSSCRSSCPKPTARQGCATA